MRQPVSLTHHLRLFGIPQLLDPQGRPVALRTRKHLGVLVYLAVEGRDRPVARDVLIELFWSDAPPVRARHSLSQACSAIRGRLGNDALVRSAAGVSLVRGMTTDLDPQVKRHLSAPDLARPLDGLESCGGVAFEHWVDRARDRCSRLLGAQLLADLTAARTLGNLADLRQAASLLYALDPFSDIAALALAEQHLLDGDSPSAIRHLRAHMDRTQSELRRDPPKDLVSLLGRLEHGFIPRHRLPAASPEEARNNLLQPDVFVGRQGELSRLEAAWTAACRGDLTTCLVAGGAGVGKSALVRRFATSVSARAWPAYVVVSQEMGSNVPFATVSGLVHQLMRDPALGGTDPAWLAEASRVTPALRARYTGIPEPAAMPAEAVRLRVAEAIFRMLETVTDAGPLLLVLDHLKNIDPASRAVLHVLTLRLRDTPTLLLATMRSSDTEYLKEGPETACGIDWTSVFELSPLEQPEILELISRLYPRTDEPAGRVARRIAEFAQGNPYLTEMLLSDWRKNGTDSLVARETRELAGQAGNDSWTPPQPMRIAFQRQYRGLSTDAQRLVHVLAIAGRIVSPAELESVLNISAATLHAAALELIEHAIVRTESGSLGFKNELHRAYVYWAMSKDARDLHHARLARALSDSRTDDDCQGLLEVSHHYLKAGMREEAVDAVCTGAEWAVTRGAPKEAEKALRTVIAAHPELPAAKLQLLLARALTAEGRYSDALDMVTQWHPVRPTRQERAHAMGVQAEAFHRGRLADDDTIVSTVSAGLSLAETTSNDLLVMHALQLSAEVASETGDWDALNGIRARAASVQESSRQNDAVALSKVTQGYCNLVTGNLKTSISQFKDCLEDLESLSLMAELRQAMNGLGMAHYCLGEWAEATKHFRTAIEVATRIGDTVASATSWSNLGAIQEDLGEFGQAERCYRRAMEMEAQASNPRRAAEVYMNLSSLCLTMSNTSDAVRYLATASENAKESQLWWLVADVLLTEADYHIACGDPELAWPLVEEAQECSRGRLYLLSNRGRFERLRRHHLWCTQGWEAVESIRRSENLNDRCLLLAARLEVEGFVEWLQYREGVLRKNGPSAFDQLMRMGFFGVVKRLSALHVHDPARERE